MSRTRVVLVMLFCAAFLTPVSAAHAGYSVLCTGYASCADKGYSNYGYASNKGTSYWRMYTGTNCTNYVAYRLVTTNGMPNTRPKSGVGNAQDWGTAMKSVTNSTPTVGSVAWWGKTGHHVAYVEKVVSSTEVWVSESNWSGAFDWRKITKSGSGWPDGFIHFKDPAIVNNTRPEIRGTVKVGGALKAWGGDWTPKGNTYVYRWRADGKNIPGATGTTFTPTTAELGKDLSVSVTASRTSYPTKQAVSLSTKVAAGTLSATKAPAITGTARVDSTLTASTGTWDPGASSYAYQWLRDGTPIAKATAKTYTLAPADAGAQVTVRVTAALSGYSKVAATSAPTAKVAEGPLSATKRPSISGTAKIGSTLTARPGTWSKTGLTYDYQWFVGGTAVTGATGTTFVPRAADLGKTVTVHVTARRDGYVTTTAISPQSAAVARGTFTLKAAPVVTGNPRVGTWLTASTGTWSPKGAVSYRWYANGKEIAGATGRQLKPTKAHRGLKIRVRVTVRGDGFTAAAASSANTKAVDYGRIGVTTAPSIKGTPRLGSSVSVNPGVHTPTGASLHYQWLRDGKVVAGGTGRTHKVNVNDLGHRLSARVTLSAAGYTKKVVTTARTAAAKAPSTVKASAHLAGRDVTFTIRVAATGVAAPSGTVTLRSPGLTDRTAKVTKGTATLLVKNQKPGAHTYVFTWRGTSTVASATYTRSLTID